MKKIINIFRQERVNSSNALISLIMIVLGLFQFNNIDVASIEPEAIVSGSVVALINLVVIITKNMAKFNSGEWSFRYLYTPNALVQWFSFVVGVLEYVGVIPVTTSVQVAGALQSLNFGKHVYQDDFKPELKEAA